MSWKVITSVVVAEAILTSPVLAQTEDPFAFRVEDRQSIVRLNLRTGEQESLISATGYVPAHSLRVSTEGDLLAFLEKEDRDFYAPQHVVVARVNGERVSTLGYNVQRFEFCCQQDELAMIEGQRSEGGYGFIPEELVVVDVAGNRTPIAVPNPYELSWSAFDSSLYIKSISREGAQVYRFHAPSGELSFTRHRGIQLSPDAKYYLDPAVTAPSRLFRTEDDIDLTATLPSELVMPGSIPSWVSGSDHTLSYTIQVVAQTDSGNHRLRRAEGKAPAVPTRTYFVDASTGSIIELVDGDAAAGWVSSQVGVPVDLRGSVRLHRPKGDRS